jgi:hypothetical protein
MGDRSRRCPKAQWPALLEGLVFAGLTGCCGSVARAQSVWKRAFDPRPRADFDDRFEATYLDPRSATCSQTARLLMAELQAASRPSIGVSDGRPAIHSCSFTPGMKRPGGAPTLDWMANRRTHPLPWMPDTSSVGPVALAPPCPPGAQPHGDRERDNLGYLSKPLHQMGKPGPNAL